MKDKRTKSIDILCAGELLADLMTTDYADQIDGNRLFRPLQGGSPANLCLNMHRLGNNTALVATVGKDGMGDFLLSPFKDGGVDISSIQRIDSPSTLVLVTQSLNLPQFEVYRSADCQILPEQFPAAKTENCTLFHTTCFGLSRVPARDSILQAAKTVKKAGGQLSIDMNYAQKIWPNREEAQQVVKQYCELSPLVKLSEVDWQRLFGTPVTEAREVISFLLSWGAREVCLTLGAEGCYIGDYNNVVFIPAKKVTVRDTTGAGDAFWSAYLTAWLDGHGLEECGLAGSRMASYKIQRVDPLPEKVDKELIYRE